MRYWFIIFVLLIGAFPLNAQDSLSVYVNIAMEHNPDVLQKYYEYQATAQKVPQVAGLPDPELTMGVFLSPMEVVNGSQVANIQLMQMFPWFGVLKNARQEMNFMAKARYDAYSDAKQQIIYQMQISWLDIFKTRQNIKFLNFKLELLKSQERLLTAGLSTSQEGSSISSATVPDEKPSGNEASSSGMQTMGNSQQSTPTQNSGKMQRSNMAASSTGKNLSDYYKLEIEITELQNTLQNSLELEKTMVSRFNSFLDRSFESNVFTPDTIYVQNIDTTTLFPDSLLKDNPMLSMIKNDIQSADARKKMVSAMGYPMIGVGLEYSLINKSDMSTSSMNGKDMLMPMIKVTLPVYRKKYNSMKHEADFVQQAQASSYRSGYLNLMNDFHETIQLYNDAIRRIKLYGQQLEITDRILRIATKSFSSGVVELNDIILIRKQKYDLEQSLIEAVVDNHKAIAKINLIKGSKN